MNAIFTRTSVRKFENRSVEKEKIEKLLQAGFVAQLAHCAVQQRGIALHIHKAAGQGQHAGERFAFARGAAHQQHLQALGQWLADNDTLGWKYDLPEDR